MREPFLLGSFVSCLILIGDMIVVLAMSVNRKDREGSMVRSADFHSGDRVPDLILVLDVPLFVLV